MRGPLKGEVWRYSTDDKGGFSEWEIVEVFVDDNGNEQVHLKCVKPEPEYGDSVGDENEAYPLRYFTKDVWSCVKSTVPHIEISNDGEIIEI